MRITVFGAGMMSCGVVFDLLQNEELKDLTVVDINSSVLNQFKKRFSDSRLKTFVQDISDLDSVVKFIEGRDCVVNATHYKFNYHLSKICIENSVNFCDMGGNNDIVAKQLTLDAKAKEKGVTIIPDCGLAPGLANIAAARFSENFDSVESIKIRVGGVPQKPKTLLKYQLVFSVEGLINEYIEKALILRDGKEIEVDSMSGCEEIDFPEPFGKMEAFYTSGGTSTLTKTLSKKVKELDYKTIRYRGHCKLINLLIDLGLTSSKAVTTDGTKLIPRAFLGKLLKNYLPKDEPDAVLISLDIQGMKNEGRFREKWQLMDFYDERNHLSAMQRTTAFPVAIIAAMLAKGKIEVKGVVPQEISVPSEPFFRELSNRHIEFFKKENFCAA